MKNIGTLVYTRWNQPGSLMVRWCHSELGAGVGEAYGGPTEGFVGEYRVIYRNKDTDQSEEMRLVIEESCGRYQLTWWQQDKLIRVGEGMILGEQLIAGWKSCQPSD